MPIVYTIARGWIFSYKAILYLLSPNSQYIQNNGIYMAKHWVLSVEFLVFLHHCKDQNDHSLFNIIDISSGDSFCHSLYKRLYLTQSLEFYACNAIPKNVLPVYGNHRLADKYCMWHIYVWLLLAEHYFFACRGDISRSYFIIIVH